MSKSKGNVVDPLELIDAYGADAVRFTVCALASPGRDIKLAKARLEGYRAFVTKLWNAARFCEMNGIAARPDWDPATAETPLARWILDGANAAAAEAAAALNAFRFDDYAAALYRFTWNSFCDWFLEFAKPVLNGPDGPEKEEVRGAAQHVLGTILRLLHPVMPFVTEELWTQLGYGGEASLIRAEWPVAVTVRDAEGARVELDWVIDLISQIRGDRTAINVPPGAILPIHQGISASGAADGTESQDVRLVRYRALIERLARVTIEDPRPYGTREPAVQASQLSLQLIVGGGVYFLQVGDSIDLDAERARLSKDRAKADGEIEKVQKKLGNAEFVAKAKPEVIEENRERLESFAAEIARLDAALARIAAG